MSNKLKNAAVILDGHELKEVDLSQVEGKIEEIVKKLPDFQHQEIMNFLKIVNESDSTDKLDAIISLAERTLDKKTLDSLQNLLIKNDGLMNVFQDIWMKIILG